MEQRWRILIIDDDRSFRCSIACVLERWASVRAVEEIETARMLLTSWQPHAVILDPVLRSGDSFELLGWLTAEEPRIVFCSLSRRVRFPPRCCKDPIVYVPREWPAGLLGPFIERKVRSAFAEPDSTTRSRAPIGNGRGGEHPFDSVLAMRNGPWPARPVDATRARHDRVR